MKRAERFEMTIEDLIFYTLMCARLLGEDEETQRAWERGIVDSLRELQNLKKESEGK